MQRLYLDTSLLLPLTKVSGANINLRCLSPLMIKSTAALQRLQTPSKKITLGGASCILGVSHPSRSRHFRQAFTATNPGK